MLAAVMLAFGVFAEVSDDEPPAIADRPSEGATSAPAWPQLCWLNLARNGERDESA